MPNAGRSQSVVQPLHKVSSGIATMPPAGAPKRGAGFVWAKHGKELVSAGRAPWNSTSSTLHEATETFRSQLRDENISACYGSGKKVYRLSGIAGRPHRAVSERNRFPITGKPVYLSLEGNEFISLSEDAQAAVDPCPSSSSSATATATAAATYPKKPSMEALALKTADHAVRVPLAAIREKQKSNRQKQLEAAALALEKKYDPSGGKTKNKEKKMKMAKTLDGFGDLGDKRLKELQEAMSDEDVRDAIDGKGAGTLKMQRRKADRKANSSEVQEKSDRYTRGEKVLGNTSTSRGAEVEQMMSQTLTDFHKKPHNPAAGNDVARSSSNPNYRGRSGARSRTADDSSEELIELKVLPSFMHRTFSSLRDPEREFLNQEAFTLETRHQKWKLRRFSDTGTASRTTTASTATPGAHSPADGAVQLPAIPTPHSPPEEVASTLIAKKATSTCEQEHKLTKSATVGQLPAVKKSNKASTSSREQQAGMGEKKQRMMAMMSATYSNAGTRCNNIASYYDDVTGKMVKKTKWHVPKSMYDTSSLSPRGNGLHLNKAQRCNLEQWPEKVVVADYDRAAMEFATLEARRNPQSRSFWNPAEHYSTQTKRDFPHPDVLAKRKRVPDRRTKSVGHGMQKQFYTTISDGFPTTQTKKHRLKELAPSPTDQLVRSADDDALASLHEAAREEELRARSLEQARRRSILAHRERMEASRSMSMEREFSMERGASLERRRLREEEEEHLMHEMLEGTVLGIGGAAAEESGSAAAGDGNAVGLVVEGSALGTGGAGRPLEGAAEVEEHLQGAQLSSATCNLHEESDEEDHYTADGRACYKGITWAMIERIPPPKPAPKYSMLSDGSGFF
eukprot:g10690.t1